MRCPFCNQDNTRVVDSRPVEDTNSIRRRRLCDACGKRFTTYEKVETIPLTVIKKDQNRESYKRSKIQDGVLRACYKRPIPIERVEEMIDSIEGDIFRSEDREISSTKIGEIVMEHLKDLDAVAYVRFASVYREFKDVSTFMAGGVGGGGRHVVRLHRAVHQDCHALHTRPIAIRGGTGAGGGCRGGVQPRGGEDDGCTFRPFR